MSRPSLVSIDAWGAHERRCAELLHSALDALAPIGLDESEDELNRRLYFHICQTARAIEQRDGTTLPVVVPEGLNPPLATDEQRATREFKRPDFYWAYHDPDGDEPARQFVVECKRLTAAGATWVYTEQYVIAGVRRFVAVDHGYGKEAWAGAMVGYIQRIPPDRAHSEVNAHLGTAGLPPLGRVPGASASVSGFGHELDRAFVHSPFRLLHLWRLPGP